MELQTTFKTQTLLSLLFAASTFLITGVSAYAASAATSDPAPDEAVAALFECRAQTYGRDWPRPQKYGPSITQVGGRAIYIEEDDGTVSIISGTGPQPNVSVPVDFSEEGALSGYQEAVAASVARDLVSSFDTLSTSSQLERVPGLLTQLTENAASWGRLRDTAYYLGNLRLWGSYAEIEADVEGCIVAVGTKHAARLRDPLLALKSRAELWDRMRTVAVQATEVGAEILSLHSPNPGDATVQRLYEALRAIAVDNGF